MRILEELPLDGKPVLCIGSADLCELLALSPGALSDLKKRGLAVHRGHDAYDLAQTVTAYVVHLRGIASGRGGEEQTATLTTERARMAKEQADALAMKNAARRGELVPAADVERAWFDLLKQVQARILAVPSRLRQSLGLAPTDAEAIDRELREALSELGNHGND